MKEQQKRRFTWSWTESWLTVVWIIAFVTFKMVFRSFGFWEALSQFLNLANIVLTAVVVFGILGVHGFVAGLRGK